MKTAFWIFFGLFIIGTPLFIYDMTQQGINLQYLFLTVLLLLTYHKAFKEPQERAGEAEKKK